MTAPVMQSHRMHRVRSFFANLTKPFLLSQQISVSDIMLYCAFADHHPQGLMRAAAAAREEHYLLQKLWAAADRGTGYRNISHSTVS